MLQLTQRQQATVGAALTLLCGLFIVFAVLGLFIALTRFVDFFSAVLAPLVVAAVLVTLVRPYYVWLVRQTRQPALSVVLVLLSITLPLVAVFGLFGSLIVSQIAGLLHQIPVWFDQAQTYLNRHAPAISELWKEYELGDRFRAMIERQGGTIARGMADVGGGLLAAGAGVFRAITGLFGWVVMPVYFVFLLRMPVPSKKGLESLMPFLKAETRADVAYLVNEFGGIMTAFFRGQLLIALLQGVLYSIGFKLVGLQYGVAIGMLMGLLNVVPYLGSLLGLAMALPTAFFQADGGLTSVAMTGAAIVVVQCIEGYVLTPRIMGDRTGLHPMAIIFAMFFWGTALGGIMGMILAIPLTAFLVVFWRLAKSRYIKEIV